MSRSTSAPLPSQRCVLVSGTASRAGSLTVSWPPARGLGRGKDAGAGPWVCLDSPVGTAEFFSPSSQWLFLVSALLQETCSIPGGAETVFGLLHAALLGCVSSPGSVSVPKLAQLSLSSAGEMLEKWMLGGQLHWPGLGISSRDHHTCWDLRLACAGSAWGVPSATTCLKQCQGQTNGNITAILTTLKGAGWPAYPSPVDIMLSLCSAGL